MQVDENLNKNEQMNYLNPLTDAKYGERVKELINEDVDRISSELIDELIKRKSPLKLKLKNLPTLGELVNLLVLHQIPNSKGYTDSTSKEGLQGHAKLALGTIVLSSLVSKDAFGSLLERSGYLVGNIEATVASFISYFILQQAKQLLFDKSEYNVSELVKVTIYQESQSKDGNLRIVEVKRNLKLKLLPWLGVVLSSFVGIIAFYNTELGLNPEERKLMYEYEVTKLERELKDAADISTKDIKVLEEILVKQENKLRDKDKLIFERGKIEEQKRLLLREKQMESEIGGRLSQLNQIQDKLQAKEQEVNRDLQEEEKRINEVEKRTPFLKYLRQQRQNEITYRINQQYIQSQGDRNDNRRNNAIRYNQGDRETPKGGLYKQQKDKIAKEIENEGGKFFEFGSLSTPQQEKYEQFKRVKVEGQARATLENYITKLTPIEDQSLKKQYEEIIVSIESKDHKYYKGIGATERIFIGLMRVQQESKKGLPASFINAFLILVFESILLINSARIIKDRNINEIYMNRNLQLVTMTYKKKLSEQVWKRIRQNESIKQRLQDKPKMYNDFKKYVQRTISDLSFSGGLDSLNFIADQQWRINFGIIEAQEQRLQNEARSVRQEDAKRQISNWRKGQDEKNLVLDESIASSSSTRHKQQKAQKIEEDTQLKIAQERAKQKEDSEIAKLKAQKQKELQDLEIQKLNLNDAAEVNKQQQISKMKMDINKIKLKQLESIEQLDSSIRVRKEIRNYALQLLQDSSFISKLDEQIQKLIREEIQKMSQEHEVGSRNRNESKPSRQSSSNYYEVESDFAEVESHSSKFSSTVDEPRLTKLKKRWYQFWIK